MDLIYWFQCILPRWKSTVLLNWSHWPTGRVNSLDCLPPAWILYLCLGTILVTFDCDFSPSGKKLPTANSSLWKGMLVTASVLQCYIITSVLYKSHHPSQVHYKVPTDGILKSEDGGIYGQQRDSEKRYYCLNRTACHVSLSHICSPCWQEYNSTSASPVKPTQLLEDNVDFILSHASLSTVSKAPAVESLLLAMTLRERLNPAGVSDPMVMVCCISS